MPYVKTLVILGALILFSGCTTKAWYEGGQYEAKRNCHNQPPSEIDQCLENVNKKTYEEYEKNH